MNQEIKKLDKVFALLSPLSNLSEKNKTEWFGASYEPLQGSRMYYDKKTFRCHRHKLNPRTIHHTQECFIVISGSIEVVIYDNDKNLLGSLCAKTGDVIFIWDGYHELNITEDDSIVYEIKCGQFTTLTDDKEYF